MPSFHDRIKQQGSKVRVRCHVEKQTNGASWNNIHVMRHVTSKRSNSEHRCRAGAVLRLVLQFLLSVAPSAFISVNICCTSACCSATFPWDIIRNRKNKPNKHPLGSQALQCTAINQQVVTADQKCPVHAALLHRCTLRDRHVTGELSLHVLRPHYVKSFQQFCSAKPVTATCKKHQIHHEMILIHYQTEGFNRRDLRSVKLQLFHLVWKMSGSISKVLDTKRRKHHSFTHIIHYIRCVCV